MMDIRRRRRGTIISYFLVLVSVLGTGLLTTMALTAGSEAQVAGITLKRDQAFYAAEAGIQEAFYRLQLDNSWRAAKDTPLVQTITNGNSSATFSVTAIGDWNSSILVTSIGTVGSTSSRVFATASPKTIVPAITLGNDFDNSGNVTIDGDVQALGNISTSGRLKVIGSLIAGKTISINGSVDISGVTTPNQTGLTVPTVDDIRSLATQIIDVPNTKNWNPPDLNFGNGGIIYFRRTGPVSSVEFKGNVGIIGHGTLISDVDVSIKAAASFGSASDPAIVNMVIDGALDVSGYLGLVGSLVANGNISKNGGLNINGVVVGNINLDTNGGMTITRAQPPAWIHYAGLSGIGSMSMKSVVGPIF